VFFPGVGTQKNPEGEEEQEHQPPRSSLNLPGPCPAAIPATTKLARNFKNTGQSQRQLPPNERGFEERQCCVCREPALSAEWPCPRLL